MGNAAQGQTATDQEINERLTDAIRAYDGGDLETAWESWQWAARAGNTDAMTFLASMLERGEGLRPDTRRAAAWYRRAAERGDTIGQLNLGEMYLNGRGLKRDRVEAVFWLTLAGRGGNVWAAEKSVAAATGLNIAARKVITARVNKWTAEGGAIR